MFSLLSDLSLTQTQKILNMLRKRDRKPYEFTQAGILSYTKRVHDLRKKGYVITIQKTFTRKKNVPTLHTIYHLES